MVRSLVCVMFNPPGSVYILWIYQLDFFFFMIMVQDTLYLHYGKQYLKDCYIEGSVDFIFGNSTALLEHCHIHCKSQGFITAQGRKSSQESTGYVFLRCVNDHSPLSTLSSTTQYCVLVIISS
jgi:pectin methylesterase-like acyl-CoA thioesterase